MGMKTAVILRSTLTLIRGTTRRAHLQVPAMANDQIIVIKFCFCCILFRFVFVFFNKRSSYIRGPTHKIALELKRKGILQNTTLLKQALGYSKYILVQCRCTCRCDSSIQCRKLVTSVLSLSMHEGTLLSSIAFPLPQSSSIADL